MSDTNMIARDQLRSFVERIERLEEEKKTTADDIKDVYAEVKGNGFDTKVLRKVITLRKQDPNERQEFEAVLDLYLQSLGMLPSGITEELPMEMERVRSRDRPKTGAEEVEAEQAAERRAAPIDEATVKAATAKPPKGKRSGKPKDADEARARLAANSPIYE